MKESKPVPVLGRLRVSSLIRALRAYAKIRSGRIFPEDRKITTTRHSRTVENREPIGDHIFFAFANLPKVTMNSNKARASLREIPEDVSVFTPIKWTVQLRIDTLIAQRAHSAGGAVGSPAVVETFYVIE